MPEAIDVRAARSEVESFQVIDVWGEQPLSLPFLIRMHLIQAGSAGENKVIWNLTIDLHR